MIRLSERLATVASRIAPGETVADVGSDHGYLALYLAESGRSPLVIMTDISEQSLRKAKQSARLLTALSGCAGKRLLFRIGDGLHALDRGETDLVAICGLGGLTIKSILAADREKTLSFRRFILQPRNNFGPLLYFLKEEGFQVTALDLAPEKDRWCEILTISPPKGEITTPSGPKESNLSGRPNRKSVSWDLLPSYVYPDELLTTDSPFVESYLKAKLKKENKIIERIREKARIDKASSFEALVLREAYRRRIMTLFSEIGKEEAK